MAVLITGQQGSKNAVVINGYLIVVGRAAEEGIGDHSDHRDCAYHDVPGSQIPRLGLVLGYYQTRQKNTKGAENQTNSTGDQGRYGGRLFVLGLDVLGHEDPVGHVTHEVEYGSKIVAHQRGIGQ